ncbi:tetratricopeptide repeat protein, partial [Streptomyces sp. NPDC001787]|uniref:tetratricopeptide repeat protein n=1 Tax=Streptomyces sp. NPDC001787 TaxID=3154523 RepID=UPI00332F2768
WAITQRGITRRLMGLYDEALTDFNHALELDNTDTWAITQRGITRRLMGLYDEALTDFNHALELDNTYVWAITQRGSTHRQAGRLDDALSDLTHAIELDPSDVHALAERCISYRQGSRPGEARADLEILLQASPDDADYLFEQAMLNTVTHGLGTALPDWTVLFGLPFESGDMGMGGRFIPFFRKLLLEPDADPIPELQAAIGRYSCHDTAVDLFLYLGELEAVPGAHVRAVTLCQRYLLDHSALPLPCV